MGEIGNDEERLERTRKGRRVQGAVDGFAGVGPGDGEGIGAVRLVGWLVWVQEGADQEAGYF